MTAIAKGRRIAILLSVALPLSAQAQMKADELEWGASIYGWFPSVSGQTAFPTGGTSISVDADKLLENLKFTFMGTLEVQKGPWGVWTDVIYMNLGNSKSATRDFILPQRAIPADVSANFDYDLKAWLWTIAGTYSLVKKPEYSLQALLGARMIDAKQSLDFNFNGNIASLGLPTRSGSAEVTLTNWDAIIGVKGRASFGDGLKWFVPYYLDVGTGQSKLTWQGIVGVGYAFNWGSIVAAWRYLDYEFKSGSPVENLSFNGPAIGVIFRW